MSATLDEVMFWDIPELSLIINLSTSLMELYETQGKILEEIQ